MRTILNRLLIWQKFLIVGLLGLGAVALPLGLYLREVYKDYVFTKLETEGVGPALAVLKVLQNSQQHRGLSAQTLAGREAAEAQRAAMQQKVEQDIANMEATFASALTHPKIAEPWRSAVQEWKTIVSSVRDKSLTVEQSFQLHTELNTMWLSALEQIRDIYGISLDPEASGYFLHLAALVALPNLTEILGQARARGTGLLAQQKASDVDKIAISTLLSRTQEYQTTTIQSVEKAYNEEPTLRPKVGAKLSELNAKVHDAVRLAEINIVQANPLTFSSSEYFAQYTTTINTVFEAVEAMTAELHAILQKRLADALRLTGFLLGGVLLLTLVAASITYIVTRSIAVSARQLSEAVEKFAQGDDQARANIDSTDEIGQLSTAFNKMIDERITTLQFENDQLNTSVVELLQAVATLAQKDLTHRVPVAEDVTGPVSDALNLLTEETAGVLLEVMSLSNNVATASRSVKVQSDTVLQVAGHEREQVTYTAEQLAAAADTMNNIATLAQNCNAIAENAINRTQTALESVSNTVEGIHLIRDTIRETEKRIKRLGERSQEISGAVNLINGIADRTHILALNASMHAASAGEAGRGFAVVADEVQRLAENARQSTEEIARLVSNIQTETMDTVSTMNTVITQVVEGSRLAGQAGEQMRQTQQTTADLVASVRQIASGAQEQAKVSNTLRDRAGDIVQSTLKTSEQLTAQDAQTSRLLEYASRLVRTVQVFKLPNPSATASMHMEPAEDANMTLDISDRV